MSSNVTETDHPEAGGPGASAGVLARREGSTLLLAIDRPHAGNSIDLPTAQALGRALDRHADAGDLRSVVITGAGGRFFCTGGDIKRYRAFNRAEDLNETFDAVRALLDRIERLALPVIAAIDGHALGGGVELALACDLRIAGPNASLGLPQVRMGIVPGWDGIERLVRTVGRATAMRVLLSGERHDAQAALALGLVDIASDDVSALDAALAFCRTLDDRSRASIVEIKRIVSACDCAPGQVREMTREAFARLWFGADHREAQRAAAAKEPPRFARDLSA